MIVNNDGSVTTHQVEQIKELTEGLSESNEVDRIDMKRTEDGTIWATVYISDMHLMVLGGIDKEIDYIELEGEKSLAIEFEYNGIPHRVEFRRVKKQ